MKNKNRIYDAPVAALVGLNAEGLLCGSPWYLQGGQGDFSYTIEEDDEFA